jgi:hypothetical protein
MPEPRIILVRPFRTGWEVHEAKGVEPYYTRRDYAISYARQRFAGAGNAEVHVLDAQGQILERIVR